MNTAFASRIATTARATAVATFVGLTVVSGAAGASIALAGSAAAAVDTTAPGMYGDPAKAAQYWGAQSYGNDCALMSIADVVGQITGQKPTEQQIIELAKNTPSVDEPGHPVYTDPNGDGVATGDIAVVLARYGIHATTSGDAKGDAGLDVLKKALAERHAVMAFVSSGPIWQGSAPSAGDHEVVVTGVDTANNIVHLNDSGTDEGRDEQVSLATFMQAWSGSGFQITVTQETVQ